jgi:hypothetical protein
MYTYIHMHETEGLSACGREREGGRGREVLDQVSLSAEQLNQ